MKLVLVALCFLTVVYCQTQNKNGNPTGEIGQPAFDEIVVHSTLTVRGKSGSRSGKSLITNPKQKEPEVEANKENAEGLNNARVAARRSRRSPIQSQQALYSAPKALREGLNAALHKPIVYNLGRNSV